MGTWGPGIFDNDVALDLRRAFERGLSARRGADVASRFAREVLRDYFSDGQDQINAYLALAALQLEYGALEPDVRERAMAFIRSGSACGGYEADSAARRRDILVALEMKLAPVRGDPASLSARADKHARHAKLTPEAEVQYREGQWFAVPLRSGGYALGLLVRGGNESRGGIGYFFGPKFASVPDEQSITGKEPSDAILVARFGDLGLIQGRWPLLSVQAAWNRNKWPVPRFVRGDDQSSVAWIVQYDDSGTRVTKEERSAAGTAAALPRDGLYSAGAIEAALTAVLDGRVP